MLLSVWPHTVAVVGQSLSMAHMKSLQRTLIGVGRHPPSSANPSTKAIPFIQRTAQVRGGKEPCPHTRIPSMVFHRYVGPRPNTWPTRRFAPRTVRNVRSRVRTRTRLVRGRVGLWRRGDTSIARRGCSARLKDPARHVWIRRRGGCASNGHLRVRKRHEHPRQWKRSWKSVEKQKRM